MLARPIGRAIFRYLESAGATEATATRAIATWATWTSRTSEASRTSRTTGAALLGVLATKEIQTVDYVEHGIAVDGVILGIGATHGCH